MSSLTKFPLNNFFLIFTYESHLAKNTSEPLEKIVKILETRPQSSEIAKKLIKNRKIHDVDKITPCSVFKVLFVFHPGASTTKHKLKFRQKLF